MSPLLLWRDGRRRLWHTTSNVPTGGPRHRRRVPAAGSQAHASSRQSQGESATSYAWSAGVQLTPPWFGGKDALGVGYSHQQEPDARERVAEVYYRFTMAAWLSVVATVQWVLSGPNLVTGGENRNLVVPGLRALLQF